MGRLRDFLKKNPFLLAHHPSCEKFSHHTLDFRDWKLCLGCFIIYPSAIVALIFIYLGSFFLEYDYMGLLIVSIALFGVNLLRKVLYKDDIKQWAHVASRIILGGSLAFILSSILIAPEPQNLLILALLLGVAIGYNLINGRKYLQTCKGCDQYSKFPKCEGLSGELEKDEKY